jgi:hypothetical protein
VDTDGRNPVECVAALMRGSILQHGFRKYVMRNSHNFRRRQYDMSPLLLRRIRFVNQQNMLAIHEITSGFPQPFKTEQRTNRLQPESRGRFLLYV